MSCRVIFYDITLEKFPFRHSECDTEVDAHTNICAIGTWIKVRQLQSQITYNVSIYSC